MVAQAAGRERGRDDASAGRGGSFPWRVRVQLRRRCGPRDKTMGHIAVVLPWGPLQAHRLTPFGVTCGSPAGACSGPPSPILGVATPKSRL